MCHKLNLYNEVSSYSLNNNYSFAHFNYSNKIKVY